MNTNLVSYYSERAKEYEKIYLKAERQEDLKNGSQALQEIFRDKNMLEICCGTGYWTEKIAATAHSIFATDINKSMLEIAQSKSYPKANVTFGIADLFTYVPPQKFEALFGGFIWSHIQLQDLDDFLSQVNKFVMPGGLVVFMDNHFVEGSNHPITTTDQQGNTFQARKLADGTDHLVLKNFPTEAFLREKFIGIATDIQIIHFSYFWILAYRTMNQQ